jgi:murein peptide amidase A
VSQTEAEPLRRAAVGRPRFWLAWAAVAVAAVTGTALLDSFTDRSASGPISSARAGSRPSIDPVGRRRLYLGRSVRGRPIYAIELGDLDNEHSTLVVGVIHGNETAGVPIAKDLATRRPPREKLLFIVTRLNPDGVAAGTRQNADGVDLNRNFPWRWRILGTRGDLQYSGPRPLSEPEARIAHSLILRERPKVTIWFHQPLGLVDESGGSVAVERRFARLARLPLQRLTRYPGSAAGWQNHRLPHTTAFVVELRGGRLSSANARRYARAVLKVAS